MVKTVNFFLTFIGLFFILVGAFAFYNGVELFGISGIFWFSYVALFLTGVGIYTKNSSLIASQLCIILIPYIFWNIDFFYVLATGNSLWGITDYFFQPRPLLAQIISVQHVFIVPISLLAIYFIKLKRKDFWIFSVIQVVLFYFLARILSNLEDNVNCAFQNCMSFYISPEIYPFFWFLAYFAMIGITALALTRIKAFNIKHSKKKGHGHR